MNAEFMKYKDILDNLYDGVYFVDKERKIVYWNKAAEKITGFTADEIISSYCWDNILKHVDENGNFLCNQSCPLSATIIDGKIREINVFFHHKDGYRVPVYVKSIPLKDNDQIIGAIEIFSDIANREKVLEKIKNLEKLAMLDSLTQLPNRRYMENMIVTEISNFKNFNQKFGVIFIDIDNFKLFNDTYGHDLGDLALQNISKTFNNNLRNSDIISRWGGEEFVGIISVSEEKDLEVVSNKLRALVQRTEVQNGNEILSATVSIGATLVRESDTIESLLKRADELMYISKSNGKNKVTIK